MDEQEQQNAGIKRTSDTLKQGAKEQAKQSRKKIFKKIIGSKVIKVLLISLIAAILVVILLYAFSWLLTRSSSNNSKQSSAEAIVYTYTENGEDDNSELTGYMVNPTIDIANKGYRLNYIFKDEEGNESSENVVLHDIKSRLEGEKKDISRKTMWAPKK